MGQKKSRPQSPSNGVLSSPDYMLRELKQAYNLTDEELDELKLEPSPAIFFYTTKEMSKSPEVKPSSAINNAYKLYIDNVDCPLLLTLSKLEEVTQPLDLTNGCPRRS